MRGLSGGASRFSCFAWRPPVVAELVSDQKAGRNPGNKNRRCVRGNDAAAVLLWLLLFSNKSCEDKLI